MHKIKIGVNNLATVIFDLNVVYFKVLVEN